MSLVSHISSDSFIVRFMTLYEDKPYAQIFYVKDSVTDEYILKSLRQDTLTVQYNNGRTGQIVNPFKFPVYGKTLVSSQE